MTEMEMVRELRRVVAAAAGLASGNREKVKAEIRAQLVDGQGKVRGIPLACITAVEGTTGGTGTMTNEEKDLFITHLGDVAEIGPEGDVEAQFLDWYHVREGTVSGETVAKLGWDEPAKAPGLHRFMDYIHWTSGVRCPVAGDPRPATPPIRNNRVALDYGISFTTAQLVFQNLYRVTEEDPHPDEQRWRTTGIVGPSVIIVVHTWSDEGPGRIISARRATRRERRTYEEGNGQAH